MSDDTATTVRVAYQFELTVEAPASDEASYFACGGTAVLGDWDADRAVKLAPVAGSAGLYLGRSATHTVRLSGDDEGSEALEYKFMYRIGDGTPVWIPGDNLRIAGPALEDANATTVAEVDGTARSSPRAAVCLRRTAHTWVVTRDDGTGVVLHDPYLEPFSGALRHRYGVYQRMKASIDSMGGLDKFTRGYDFYGFTRVEAGDGHRAGIMYREWAPGARAASVVGDFNGWDASRHPCKRNEFVRVHCRACGGFRSRLSVQGVFEAFLEDSEDGTPQIPHDSFVKVSLVLESGERVLRVRTLPRPRMADRSHRDPPPRVPPSQLRGSSTRSWITRLHRIVVCTGSRLRRTNGRRSGWAGFSADHGSKTPMLTGHIQARVLALALGLGLGLGPELGLGQHEVLLVPLRVPRLTPLAASPARRVVPPRQVTHTLV